MPLTVVLVQGNVAQGQKWTRTSPSGSSATTWTSPRRARAAGPAVVIWPETSFPGLLDVDEPARQAIAQATGGAPALVGSVRFDAAAATAQQPVRGARRRRDRRHL